MELFEGVQEGLPTRQAKGSESGRTYELTGFGRCTHCGSPVAGACLLRKYRRYRCRGTVRTVHRPALCDAPYIPADEYEEVVWLRVSEARLIELYGDEKLDREALDSQIAPIKDLSDGMKKELQVLEGQEWQREELSELERRVREVCQLVSDRLDRLDAEGRRAVYAAFGVSVKADLNHLLITLRVSPECTTTERT